MRGDKTITEGANSQLERERKRQELIDSIYQQEKERNKPGGFCGICGIHYSGNYSNHKCTI